MKRLRTSVLLGMYITLATAGIGPSTLAAEAASQASATSSRLSLSNKWRLQCSGGANSAGEIVLRITPKDGDAIDVTAAIKDGRGENGVARDIRDALKGALDPKRFHVEVDDGEDVLIKKRGGPNFEARLVSSTVKGVRISFDKE
jgi:hypothetical protein